MNEIGQWITENYLWLVVPAVSFFAFLLLWGACAAGGMCDEVEREIEHTF